MPPLHSELLEAEKDGKIARSPIETDKRVITDEVASTKIAFIDFPFGKAENPSRTSFIFHH